MKKVRNLDKIELIFKIMFIIYVILSSNNLTYGKNVISYVMWPMILLGCILLLYRIFNWKRYIKMPLLPIFVCFAGSFLLSMLINYQYEFKQNIITLLFLCFYFFLLYTHDEECTAKDILKEFRIVACDFVLYTTVGTAISLGMFFKGYGHVEVLENGYEVVSGFVWGRLFGVFLEPNPAAVMAIISIFFLIYFIRSEKKVIVTTLGLVDIIIHTLFIAFADSRTAKVCFFVAGVLYVLMEAFKNKEKFATYKKKIIIVILAVIIGIGTNVILVEITNCYNYLVSRNEEANNQEVERNYDLEADPSNRRFDIWKSGLEIFNENKIFGTSYYGIQLYAKENLPDTYIINNTQTNFRNLHNEFLNILVSQGCIGLVIVLVLIFSYLRILKRKYEFVDKKYIDVTNTLLINIIIIAISSMFVAAGMFYYNIPSSNLFWMLLGYSVALMKYEL